MGDFTLTVKDSENADVESIPTNWTLTQLTEVADTRSGGTPSRKRLSYFGGKIPWVKSGELDDCFIDSTEEYITEQGLVNSSAKILSAGTLLVALYGATVGKTGILRIDAATNQAVCAILPRDDAFTTEYLMYHLMYRRQDLLSQRYGGAQPNISQRTLRSFQVVLPPLDEQRRIARVLSTVQRAREAIDHVIAAARQLKRSLLRHLFTYGPVPVDQVDAVELKDTRFGPVPASWQVSQLRDVAYVQTGAAKGRKLAENKSVIRPYLRVANVQDGYLDLSEIKQIQVRPSEIERYSLKSGDVVLTEGGDFDKLGRGFIWEDQIPGCLHQNHIFAVRVNQGLLILLRAFTGNHIS